MAKKPLSVDSITHDDATRLNAPTAELEAFVSPEMKRPIQVAYERRNKDLDPQLVWRGKDVADWSDLVVEAPPLYIQEKIHPKAIIEDLKRSAASRAEPVADLFADFNGIPTEAKTEFYAHEQHWSNRMILGDGLKVMASLAEREGLKGKVQCIYIDPPYGIKFNSNFQWSTTSHDVKDGKADHFSREPEQVKAFRDTWRDGIHSYLTYLRDRLTVARDLLTESGSIFVQIGDENVHRIRGLLDEVFGDENFGAIIVVKKLAGVDATLIPSTSDFLLWYVKNPRQAKYRQPFLPKARDIEGGERYDQIIFLDGTTRALSTAERRAEIKIPDDGKVYQADNIVGAEYRPDTTVSFTFNGEDFHPGAKSHWKTTIKGMGRLAAASRLVTTKGKSLRYVRAIEDFAATRVGNVWDDISGSVQSRSDPKIYVVQTSTALIQRCILMTTDPGDLVLDPTCGSGTTAYVAEQWGRRWITIDTSRVALALARARLMGARYPWYILADSREGQVKEGEITRSVPKDTPTHGRVRQGFVYKRVPHITLRDIANNAEIDTIWEQYQQVLEPQRRTLNEALGQKWQEWEIPREAEQKWPEVARAAHAEWWKQRIARQKEIDASIAAKADTEYLYDQPYDDKTRVRVAGPFTVESLSPHRVPAVDADDSLFDELDAAEGRRKKLGDGGESAGYTEMVLDNLKKSGVQQAHKADRLVFTSLKGWPGQHICAEGLVRQKSADDAADDDTAPPKRAAILVGPEYGTLSRPDLTAAAREAAEAGFDLLIAASFNFDAHASDFQKMGALTVLKARMNPDLHMPDLANTGAGNLFTVFGEPDLTVHDEGGGKISIEIAGLDMYKAGQIDSADAGDLAVWFIDTDYNYESFFVRHAYFPGASDPYNALKTTLKAEIDEQAWESL